MQVIPPALLARYNLTPEAPHAMQVRALLAERLRSYVESETTQALAAKMLEATQPHVARLMARKLEHISLDTLLTWCEHARIPVTVYVSPFGRYKRS